MSEQRSTAEEALEALRRELVGGNQVAKWQVAHDHTEYVEGCFRCDLSRAES